MNETIFACRLNSPWRRPQLFPLPPARRKLWHEHDFDTLNWPTLIV